ncbi:MAG TPA: SDR family oxidoreductase [Thermoleophilaceae bacterium]|nr:SDR family oxidoreductase [Thermoleophilaceae bacterium]
MTRELASSVVVVTGASSGIGRATALAFAEAGASLVLAARREEALQEAAAQCEERGARAVAVATDVRDEAAVERLEQTAVEHFGRLDVWVNDAAVHLFARFDEAPADLWREIMEINFFGYVHGARAAIRRFRQQGGGTLINVASVNSAVGAPYASAYVASKFALRGFAECLRDELRHEQIDVCTVLPASIDTPLFQHAANLTGRAAKPLRPIIRPERVAAAIVRCAKRPRREVIVGASGRQLVLAHALAPSLFERLMTRNVEREHFRDEPLEPTPGNVYEPMPEWTGVTGGWKQGDASPKGSGPARTAMAAGTAALTLARTAATVLAVAARSAHGRASARRPSSD